MLDEVKPIEMGQAREFVRGHHYSEVMPRITKVALGGFKDGRLMAVATLGYGTRPLHTIAKLFPSLGTADYLELGKLCVDDEMPRNTESWFISRVIQHLQREHPQRKLLYSWADGIIGKPGYVYQASNFYYGGHITTEMYLDQGGNRVHVRSIQGHPDLPRSVGKFKCRSYAEVSKLGYQKYFGYQFRYVYPLCSKKEWKLLQAESSIAWARGNYPKQGGCRWWKQTGLGKREECVLPGRITTKYVRTKA